MVYCHEQEPTRCFRALVQLLHNESGLRKVEVEAMLQESLSRTVTSGFVLTTQVIERIRDLRSDQEVIQAAKNREVSIRMGCSYGSLLLCTGGVS